MYIINMNRDNAKCELKNPTVFAISNLILVLYQTFSYSNARFAHVCSVELNLSFVYLDGHFI